MSEQREAAPLLPLLHEIREAARDGGEPAACGNVVELPLVRRRRAEGALCRLLEPRVAALLRRRCDGCPLADQEDLQQEILLAVLGGSPGFRGKTEGEAWAWVWAVANSRVQDYFRARGRRRDLERALTQDVGAYGPTEQQTPPPASALVRAEAVCFARECALRLVRDKAPADLHEEWRRRGLGATEADARRNMDVWVRVKGHGESLVEVARSLGYDFEGGHSRLRAQNRVSKHVERGRLAVCLGARAALLESAVDEYLGQELTRLAALVCGKAARRRA